MQNGPTVNADSLARMARMTRVAEAIVPDIRCWIEDMWLHMEAGEHTIQVWVNLRADDISLIFDKSQGPSETTDMINAIRLISKFLSENS